MVNVLNNDNIDQHPQYITGEQYFENVLEGGKDSQDFQMLKHLVESSSQPHCKGITWDNLKDSTRIKDGKVVSIRLSGNYYIFNSNFSTFRKIQEINGGLSLIHFKGDIDFADFDSFTGEVDLRYSNVNLQKKFIHRAKANKLKGFGHMYFGGKYDKNNPAYQLSMEEINSLLEEDIFTGELCLENYEDLRDLKNVRSLMLSLRLRGCRNLMMADNLEYVGGDLDIIGTRIPFQINVLRALIEGHLMVKGKVFFGGFENRDLQEIYKFLDNKVIPGNLYLDALPISHLGDVIEVKGDLSCNGCNDLSYFGHLQKVGGNFSLNGSGKRLQASAKYLKDKGYLKVKGTLYTSDDEFDY